MKFGFIGMGNMGLPMATNLFKSIKNPELFSIHDSNSAIASTFANQTGAQLKSSPKDIAENSNVIFTMLPNSSIVDSVFNGSNGILEFLSPGTLVIDCSTIDVKTSLNLEKLVSFKGATFFDAPVSGGTNAAKAATLSFLVGAKSKADFDLIYPILSKMGKNVFHCGPVGNGQVAKISNNLLLGIQMVGVSEAMNLGISLGMDKSLLAEIINKSTGRCWASEVYNPVPDILPNVPSSNNYNGGFGVDLMLKDLGLAVDAARNSKSTVILGSAATQVYNQMSKDGLGGKDFSVVYKWLQGKL